MLRLLFVLQCMCWQVLYCEIVVISYVACGVAATAVVTLGDAVMSIVNNFMIVVVVLVIITAEVAVAAW